MTYYITKYALSQGIRKIDSDIARVEISSLSPDLLVVYSDKTRAEFFHKGEWFADKEQALQDAESRRQKKIASLKKQIAKLENLSFTQ